MEYAYQHLTDETEVKHQSFKNRHKFLNKASKKLVYYAHINSHITYGILVWGNMIDNETKNKIQKCMDTCFNLITHLPPTPLNYKKEKMLRLISSFFKE